MYLPQCERAVSCHLAGFGGLVVHGALIVQAHAVQVRHAWLRCTTVAPSLPFLTMPTLLSPDVLQSSF